MTFNWYANLSNILVKTFAEVKHMFVQHFLGLCQKVGVGGLIVKKQCRMSPLLIIFLYGEIFV